MKVELELWHLILLLISFFGLLGGFGKVLLGQIEKRLDERFKGLEDGQTKALDVERQILTLRAELPLQYVRREDYVRNQTVIEAKLDAVATKIENLMLKTKGVS
jgi:hypothetical protein